MYKELLGEELNEKVKAVLKEKGKTLLIDDPKEPAYIPKSRFDEVIQKKNELKTQTGELSGQLEDLKKAAKGNEKLLEKIEELQSKNSEWEKKHNNSILESAIKYVALQEKAKDPTDLLHYLDKSKLQIDEQGNVKGLDEQLKSIKEKKSYLFDSGEPQKPSIPSSSGSNPQLPKFKGELGQLQDDLRLAQEKRDIQSQIIIQNKIFELQKG
jgi:hypothetical protein